MAGSTSGDQGFASMPKEKVSKIASKGGTATGGKNLTPEARAKGGRNSHGGGRKSDN